MIKVIFKVKFIYQMLSHEYQKSTSQDQLLWMSLKWVYSEKDTTFLYGLCNTSRAALWNLKILVSKNTKVCQVGKL